MRLLASGFSTAETTLAGTTGGDQSAGSGQSGSLLVRKLVVMAGGSTVAPNTSGAVKFNYGQSSGSVESTLVFPTPVGGDVSSLNQPNPAQWTLDGLGLECNWFEFATQEASAGGVSVFAFGD